MATIANQSKRLRRLLIMLGITAVLYVASIPFYNWLNKRMEWNRILDDARMQQLDAIQRHEEMLKRIDSDLEPEDS